MSGQVNKHSIRNANLKEFFLVKTFTYTYAFTHNFEEKIALK